MTYPKPKIKYTDMSIYIDNHIYESNCNWDICYQYIYHIYYMLSRKQKLFQNSRDYDDFALYAATSLALRYKKENKPKIKSVLNYAKRSVYGLSVNFKRQSYKEYINEYSATEQDMSDIRENQRKFSLKHTSFISEIDIKEYFKHIPKTIKTFLKQLPYTNQQKDLHNLYISILITIIDHCSLNIDNYTPYRNTLENKYRQRCESIKIFHLPTHMKNYINTLVKAIKKCLSKDIAYLITSNTPSEQTIKDILKTCLVEGDNSND